MSYIVGTWGYDFLYGTEEADYISALGSADSIRGHGGDDLIFAGQGRDYVDGGTGNDWVFGESGNDLIHGMAGSDMLYGGQGEDVLYGWEGDDVLAGEAGIDTMTGGSGSDRFWFAPGDTLGIIQYFGDVADKITDFSQSDGDRIDLSATSVSNFQGLMPSTQSPMLDSVSYYFLGSATVVAFSTSADGISEIMFPQQHIDFTASDFML